MIFTILGIPKPKQSMKFTKKGFSYQPKEVVAMERNLKYDIRSQLPPGHVPWDEPLAMGVQFVFPPPSGWSKKKMVELQQGAIIYKDTKPDLQDNLMKGVCDAMEGVVYVNDSRICWLLPSTKIYGLTPQTVITIHPIAGLLRLRDEMDHLKQQDRGKISQQPLTDLFKAYGKTT